MFACRRNAVGLLAISFDLWDMDGKPLLRMVKRRLELYPRRIHDFVATAKKREVTLWLGDRDIGLDLSFERIGMEDLEKLLGTDFELSKKTDAVTHKALEGMDDWQRMQLQEVLSGPPCVPSWIENVIPEIREQVREGFLTGDDAALDKEVGKGELPPK